MIFWNAFFLFVGSVRLIACSTLARVLFHSELAWQFAAQFLYSLRPLMLFICFLLFLLLLLPLVRRSFVVSVCVYNIIYIGFWLLSVVIATIWNSLCCSSSFHLLKMTCNFTFYKYIAVFLLCLLACFFWTKRVCIIGNTVDSFFSLLVATVVARAPVKHIRDRERERN